MKIPLSMDTDPNALEQTIRESQLRYGIAQPMVRRSCTTPETIFPRASVILPLPFIQMLLEPKNNPRISSTPPDFSGIRDGVDTSAQQFRSFAWSSSPTPVSMYLNSTNSRKSRCAMFQGHQECRTRLGDTRWPLVIGWMQNEMYSSTSNRSSFRGINKLLCSSANSSLSVTSISGVLFQ